MENFPPRDKIPLGGMRYEKFFSSYDFYAEPVEYSERGG